jgi:hypothetical protein
MIEALRGLGYTPGTALADLIDNSISAGATEVQLTFDWKGPMSTITVLDNGNGMDELGLERAMRLGELSPLDHRASSDLGRFGMGLKTASFSQCRRLTVASRQGSEVNCLRWDLDILASSSDGAWYLLEGPTNGSENLLTRLSPDTPGTLVIWELLDQMVPAGSTEQDFLDVIDTIEHHLAMVFHRYLSGKQPRLKLTINGRAVLPWDPFLTNHAATWSSPIERLTTRFGHIEVQCHVLPYKDRLSPAEYASGGGPDGWTAQQGFYVYRNERLLLAGNWLGLGQGRPWTKEEAHRLARIRLDIPNTADADWKIDIRKSSARPPVNLKSRLTHLAEDTRARARRVFAYRGEVSNLAKGAQVAHAWRAEHGRHGVRYRLDRTHPAIAAVLDQAGVLVPEIKAMLRVIEETIPVQRIWLDTTEQRETPRTGFAGEPPSVMTGILRVIYRNLITRRGMSPLEAREQLLRTEPFDQHPDLVVSLPDDWEEAS